MDHKATFEPIASRRIFLSGMVATGLASVFPLPATSDSLTELHVLAASRATEIAKKNRVDRLRLLMPEGCGDNIVPVIAAFSQATGISIDMIETPVDDINMQLSLDTMSGDGNYDLALPATFGVPDLVSSGAIVSLSDYAAKYETKGFREDILYSIGDSFDGELYGFQTDGDTYLMFYNSDFLDNVSNQRRYEDTYGQALDIPLTWPELDQQMAFFSQHESDIFGGLLFRTQGYLAWEWWVRFHAKGIWPLSESLEPQINSDAGVEVLEEMIRATEHLAPETHHLGLFENWERYSRGDIYCNIGWGGSQKYLNSAESNMQGRMRFGPTPGGWVNDELLVTPYFNWGWNYVVTSNSKQPELAYLFALFASSPAISTVSVQQQGGYFDPIRPEHFRDPEIQRIYSKEFLQVHEQSLRTSIPDLYLANQSQYFQVLNDWLHRALTGQVKPDIALNRVAQQWSLISNRSDKSLQTKRWGDLREKYPADARNRLRDLG